MTGKQALVLTLMGLLECWFGLLAAYFVFFGRYSEATLAMLLTIYGHLVTRRKERVYEEGNKGT